VVLDDELFPNSNLAHLLKYSYVLLTPPPNRCFALGNDKKYHAQRLGKGIPYDRTSHCRLTYANQQYKDAKKATGLDCSQPGDLGGTYTADFRKFCICMQFLFWALILLPPLDCWCLEGRAVGCILTD